MPSLTDEPYADIISRLPVGQHSVRVKAANWQQHFKKYDLSDEFNVIFGGEPEVRLSRVELQSRSSSEARRKHLEVLLWGYPSGMQGKHHIKYLCNIDEIASLELSEFSWDGYFSKLNEIKGLGLSTITKIAYFNELSFDGHRALILDGRVIEVIDSGLWTELSSLNGITYSNAKAKYLDYLQVMHRTAKSLDATGDQLELFLFALGGAFKGIVKS